MLHLRFFPAAFLIVLTACSTSVVSDDDRTILEESINAEDAMLSGPATLRADVGQSLLTFTGTRGNAATHTGKFGVFDLSLEVDAGGMPVALDLLIDIDSLVTDNTALTGHLKSPDFFDAEAYAQAEFHATKIERDGEGIYEVTGDMTMKESTRSISFPAAITTGGLKMSYVIDRNDFGIGDNSKESINSIDTQVPVEAQIIFLSQ